MALESTWDLVSGGDLQRSLLTQSRLVRCGIVKGLTTATVTSSKLALLNAIAGAPGVHALGDIYDAAFPQYICIHQVVRGIEDTGGSMVRVWEHFTTPGTSAPIERFAAEDSFVDYLEPTQRIPGTLEPMYCSPDATVVDLTADPQPAKIAVITANVPRTMRALVLYGLFANRPSAAVAEAQNCVNSATWQTRGRGYWKCSAVKARYSSADGLFAVTASFLSKGSTAGFDWSQYEFARNPQTGEFYKPTQTLMNTLKAQTYEHGMRHNKNGVYKFGPLPVANFSAVFGDSFPIGD